MVSDQAFSTAQLYFSKMPLSFRPLAYTQQLLHQSTWKLTKPPMAIPALGQAGLGHGQQVPVLAI